MYQFEILIFEVRIGMSSKYKNVENFVRCSDEKFEGKVVQCHGQRQSIIAHTHCLFVCNLCLTFCLTQRIPKSHIQALLCTAEIGV